MKSGSVKLVTAFLPFATTLDAISQLIGVYHMFAAVSHMAAKAGVGCSSAGNTFG
jgi:hypothetical protein